MASKYNLRVIRILTLFKKKKKKRQLGYDPWLLWDLLQKKCVQKEYLKIFKDF